LVTIPPDIDNVLDEAWKAAQKIPGYLGENEARFIGLLAACTPAKGTIVEIGSFRGRSTVMLAKVASHYGLAPVVAIDPHNSEILLRPDGPIEPTSYHDFLESLRVTGVSTYVEVHRAQSKTISATWTRPIRLLWIDGDHSYNGTKDDFQGFVPSLVPFGIVALHDALNVFPGPIRVFVERALRSDKFGPSGFVHSIAWAQFRPEDGDSFRKKRAWLERRASRLIPYVEDGTELKGLTKIRYKLNRSRIPRCALKPHALPTLLNSK
jgi:predicted O-methyltransferase YrrM